MQETMMSEESTRTRFLVSRGLCIGILALLGLVLICATPVQKAFAASIPELASEKSATSVPVLVKVTLNQNDTRTKSLEIIKKYRTEAIDEGIVTLPSGMTRSQYINGIVWDQDLERIAIQRAIECAVSFSHTRPDGRSCFSAQTETGSSYGEIIATPSNVEYGMALFYGEKEDYLKSLRGEDHGETGHYVALISPSNTSYGFGCVSVKGTESGSSGAFAGETGFTTANDASVGYSGEYDATVRVQESAIDVQAVLGSNVIAPGATTTITGCTKLDYGRSTLVTALPTSSVKFSSSNPAVAKVDATGKVQGVSKGEVSLTASAHGKSASKSLRVADSLSGASIASIPDQTYTGKFIQPNVVVTLNGKTLVRDRDYIVSYPGDSVSVGTKTLTITGRGDYAGTKTAQYKIVPASSGSGNSGSSGNAGGSDSGNSSAVAGSVTMLRLYNPYSGEHLFTSDANERDTLVKLGWKYEGEAWKAPTSGVAVYRLYNPNTGEHHYTTDENEYKTLQPMGWRGEGIAFYSDPSKGTPVYRIFNPHAAAFTHHYTTDSNEYTTLRSWGWNDEKIGWYGLK